MDKINYFLALFVVLSIAVFGCTQSAETSAMEKKNAMMEEEKAISEEGNATDKSGEIMEKEEAMMDKFSYTGKVLAGTASKYIEFSKADYDKALKEKKKILLYFYANWCPICRVEQPNTLSAFNEVNDPDLIGFRVNYKDSDTDANEEALAKEFGVAYQHTKVILKDGQRVGKWPDSWNKERYLEELGKI